MTALQKPVRQAQCRLWLNQWLAKLGWSFTAAAAVFMILVAVDRLWLATAHPGRFFGIAAAGLAGAAVLFSILWSFLKRDSFSAAAVRLDVAAGLKERLSTGLYCEPLEDSFARAVVSDAERMTHGVSVQKSLPIRAPRSAGYAGSTLLVALLCFWLFPSVDLSGKQEQRQEETERKDRVQRTQAMMKPLLDPQIKKLAEKNPELKKEFEDLDPLKDAKLETPLDVRTEAIKKVEKLSDKLESKKNSEELAKVDEFKKLLRRVADQQKGDTPVDSLAKSLSKGDFKSAQESLEAVKKELAKEAKTPEEKQRAEEMKKQLQQLSEKINQLAGDQKKIQDELAKAGVKKEDIQKAMDNIQKKDMDALAKQLAEKGMPKDQVDKLMQQIKKADAAAAAAKKMGGQLAKGAQGAGQQGMSKEGQQAMDGAGQQLSEMESLQQQLDQLNSSLSDLHDMKDSLGEGCKECHGTGMKNGKPCQGCQGSGLGQQQMQNGPGMGKLGRGQGGLAQQQETKTQTVQKRANVKTVDGRIISQQFVDGEQTKGEVSEGFREAAISAQRGVTDAIAREQIPRALQGPIKEYFTRSFEDVAPAKAQPQETKSTTDKP